MDFKIIVVSNQSGIARGLYTIEDLNIIHRYMQDELAKKNAYIDLILFSPYHPQGTVKPYNIEHVSRKPNPGMFYEALRKFPIKVYHSYMIGDKESDIEFGKKNGLKTILVKTGDGADTWKNREKMNIMPDFVVENLLSAAYLIKSII